MGTLKTATRPETSSFRERLMPSVAGVLDGVDLTDRRAVNRALRDAYPYTTRSGYGYRIYLLLCREYLHEELRLARIPYTPGTRRWNPPPEPLDPHQLDIFAE